jgi:phosphate transport system protein
MVNTDFRERRRRVREDVEGVFEALIISQKLVLKALEECDDKSYEQASKPIRQIDAVLTTIDNSVITLMALYTPEATDLRELVSYLKMTSVIERIVTNEQNYIKNMQICNKDTDPQIKAMIQESLTINKCTIRALEYALEMITNFDADRQKLRELSGKISVESSKTDDIYSLIEKDILQQMNDASAIKDEAFTLLKYIRKNLKITERLEDIASKVTFARLGGLIA